MSKEESCRRYVAAAHAMQSGVAADMADTGIEQPKHLRVGINAAMADQAGLAALLMAKGIFTEEEYLDAIATSMEAEKARYEKLLSDRKGVTITLG